MKKWAVMTWLRLAKSNNSADGKHYKFLELSCENRADVIIMCCEIAVCAMDIRTLERKTE